MEMVNHHTKSISILQQKERLKGKYAVSSSG